MCLPSGEYATEYTTRVPRQRALLLMDQTRRSEQCTQQQTIHQCQTQHSPPCPVCASQTFTVLSTRPADDVLAVRRVRHREHRARVPRQRALLLMDQTRRSEQSTQQQTIGRSQTRTLTSFPVVLSQILTVLSSDPLRTCLPSGEYATEFTSPECPLSVHSCSWPNPARQHQCTQQQMIGDANTMTHLLARLRIPDLHGLVTRPADDVLAVRRVGHRAHPARVPRQRALLPNSHVVRPTLISGMARAGCTTPPCHCADESQTSHSMIASPSIIS